MIYRIKNGDFPQLRSTKPEGTSTSKTWPCVKVWVFILLLDPETDPTDFELHPTKDQIYGPKTHENQLMMVSQLFPGLYIYIYIHTYIYTYASYISVFDWTYWVGVTHRLAERRRWFCLGSCCRCVAPGAKWCWGAQWRSSLVGWWLYIYWDLGNIWDSTILWI